MNTQDSSPLGWTSWPYFFFVARMDYGFAKIAQASGPFWNKAKHKLLWQWKHDFTCQHSEQDVLGC